MVRRKVDIGRATCWWLWWALVVAMLSACRRGAPTDVPPPQQPTPTLAAVSEPVGAAELPKILDHLHSLGHASFWLDGPPTVYSIPPVHPATHSRRTSS